MLELWIKQQIREQERRESDARYDLLCRLPTNTFAAIYVPLKSQIEAGKVKS